MKQKAKRAYCDYKVAMKDNTAVYVQRWHNLIIAASRDRDPNSLVENVYVAKFAIELIWPPEPNELIVN